MKKLLVTGALLGLMSTTAFAEDGIYAKLLGGVNLEAPQYWGGAYYNMNTGFAGAAALGYYIAPQVSLEADVMYTSSSYNCCSTNTLSSLSLMGNAIFHVNDTGPVQFYLGAGLGVVDLSYTATTNAKSGSQFTFGGQAIAGVEVPLASNISLLAEYRYQVAGNTTSTPALFGYNSHNAMVGLQFKF